MSEPRGITSAVFKADGEKVGRGEVSVRRFLTVEEQTLEILRLRARIEELERELEAAKRA